MSNESMTCDWCGGTTRVRRTNRDGCMYCAPYMRAADLYPQAAADNKRMALEAAASRRSATPAWAVDRCPQCGEPRHTSIGERIKTHARWRTVRAAVRILRWINGRLAK